MQFKSETQAKLKEVRDNKGNCLHRRMMVKYQKNHEAPALAEKKKILEQIRAFKKPIDHESLNEHTDKYKVFHMEMDERAQKVKN